MFRLIAKQSPLVGESDSHFLIKSHGRLLPCWRFLAPALVLFCLFEANPLFARPAFSDDPHFRRLETHGVLTSQDTVYLLRLVDFSFLSRKEFGKTDLSELMITPINQTYQRLDRSSFSTVEISELKILLMHWRLQTKRFLLSEGRATKDLSRLMKLIALLKELKVYLNEQELEGLGANHLFYETRRDQGRDNPLSLAFSSLVYQQGHLTDLWQWRSKEQRKAEAFYAGPQKKIKIHPSNGSKKWTLERWIKQEEFSEYHFEGNAVIYRGLRLLDGDFILVDNHTVGAGLYTSVTKEQSLAAHFGVIVIFEKEGRRYPAVVDMSTVGIRAVPLNIYFANRFTNYAEVYRLWDDSIRTTLRDRLHSTCMGAEKEHHAYGFTPLGKDETYLQCASVGSVLLRRSGISPIEPNTQFSNGIQKNLKILELDLGETWISPTDYITSPRTYYVGHLDNGQFHHYITNKILTSAFKRMLETKDLNLSKLPGSYGKTLWALKEVREGKSFAGLVKMFAGFNESNIPKGSDKLLGFLRSLKIVGKSVFSSTSMEYANKVPTYGPYLHSVQSRSPSTLEWLFEKIKRVEKWFDPRPGVIYPLLYTEK